jgi:predicted nucleotide-binding protein
MNVVLAMGMLRTRRGRQNVAVFFKKQESGPPHIRVAKRLVP